MAVAIVAVQWIPDQSVDGDIVVDLVLYFTGSGATNHNGTLRLLFNGAGLDFAIHNQMQEMTFTDTPAVSGLRYYRFAWSYLGALRAGTVDAQWWYLSDAEADVFTGAAATPVRASATSSMYPTVFNDPIHYIDTILTPFSADVPGQNNGIQPALKILTQDQYGKPMAFQTPFEMRTAAAIGEDSEFGTRTGHPFTGPQSDSLGISNYSPNPSRTEPWIATRHFLGTGISGVTVGSWTEMNTGETWYYQNKIPSPPPLPAPQPAVVIVSLPVYVHTKGSQRTSTVLVRDQYGSPYSGPLSWFGYATNANVTGSGTITISGGTGQFNFFANNAGHDLVSFGTLGAQAVMETITYDPNAIPTVTTPSNFPFTMYVLPSAIVPTAKIGTAVTFVARVFNETAAPRSGVPVFWTVLGVNPRTASSSTDSSGQASFSYIGNNVGPDIVIAQCGGYDINQLTAGLPDIAPVPLAGATPFAWTQDPPPPPPPVVLPVLVPTVTTVPVQQQGNVTTVQVRAMKSDGTNASGVSLVMVVTGANPQTSAAQTTDANGFATFSYTGTNAGLDAVMVRGNPGPTPVVEVFRLWTSAPPSAEPAPQPVTPNTGTTRRSTRKGASVG